MPEVHAVPSSPRRRPRALLVALLAALLALLAVTAVTAAPAARAGAFPVLKRGARGPAVKAVQRRLRIAADGRFGRGTERAVKRFQRRHRLHADGVVGPATARVLGLRAREARRTGSGTGGGAAAGAPAGDAVAAILARIARCESGGDLAAVSRDGRYRGKYQFSRETWASLGGAGDPAAASEAEQDRLARALYAQRGTAPWPNCA